MWGTHGEFMTWFRSAKSTAALAPAAHFVPPTCIHRPFDRQ